MSSGMAGRDLRTEQVYTLLEPQPVAVAAGFDTDLVHQRAEKPAERDAVVTIVVEVGLETLPVERADEQRERVLADPELHGHLGLEDVAVILEHARERELEVFELLVGDVEPSREAADHQPRDPVVRRLV